MSRSLSRNPTNWLKEFRLALRVKTHQETNTYTHTRARTHRDIRVSARDPSPSCAFCIRTMRIVAYMWTLFLSFNTFFSFTIYECITNRDRDEPFNYRFCSVRHAVACLCLSFFVPFARIYIYFCTNGDNVRCSTIESKNVCVAKNGGQSVRPHEISLRTRVFMTLTQRNFNSAGGKWKHTHTHSRTHIRFGVQSCELHFRFEWISCIAKQFMFVNCSKRLIRTKIVNRWRWITFNLNFSMFFIFFLPFRAEFVSINTYTINCIHCQRNCLISSIRMVRF